MLILINHIWQMHSTTEFISERFDPVRFYGMITYARPETHGEIHVMKHNTSDSLEEETYATCFTDLPFHFSSIIFNYNINHACKLEYSWSNKSESKEWQNISVFRTIKLILAVVSTLFWMATHDNINSK